MADRRPAPHWVARAKRPTAHFDSTVQYERERKTAANWINDMMVESRDG